MDAARLRPITDDAAPAEASAALPPPVQPLALPWPPLRRNEPSVALRPWGAQPSDPATLAAAWQDADIARWTAVPEARTEADAARWVAGEGERRDQGVALDLAITELGAPEVVVGEIGLALVEPERRWAEVGYWLFPAWRGGGRASVALDLFTDWVLRDLPIDRLFCRTHVDNPASASVAERAGYDLAGDLPDGTRVWVMDRPVVP
ncbi:GNAT family N-acetyltransferase [soil metagenome]